jgi:hypothetical protein
VYARMGSAAIVKNSIRRDARWVAPGCEHSLRTSPRCDVLERAETKATERADQTKNNKSHVPAHVSRKLQRRYRGSAGLAWRGRLIVQIGARD